MTVADRVAVMSEGRLEQYATPDKLYKEPSTLYVAGFIGTMNMYHGSLQGHGVEVDGTLIPCAQLPTQVDGAVDIAVRPEDVRIIDDEGVPAHVSQRILRGHYQELVLDTPIGKLRAFVSNDVVIDQQVNFTFQRVAIYRDGKIALESIAVHG